MPGFTEIKDWVRSSAEITPALFPREPWIHYVPSVCRYHIKLFEINMEVTIPWKRIHRLVQWLLCHHSSADTVQGISESRLHWSWPRWVHGWWRTKSSPPAYVKRITYVWSTYAHYIIGTIDKTTESLAIYLANIYFICLKSFKKLYICLCSGLTWWRHVS